MTSVLIPIGIFLLCGYVFSHLHEYKEQKFKYYSYMIIATAGWMLSIWDIVNYFSA